MSQTGKFFEHRATPEMALSHSHAVLKTYNVAFAQIAPVYLDHFQRTVGFSNGTPPAGCRWTGFGQQHFMSPIAPWRFPRRPPNVRRDGGALQGQAGASDESPATWNRSPSDTVVYPRGGKIFRCSADSGARFNGHHIMTDCRCCLCATSGIGVSTTCRANRRKPPDGVRRAVTVTASRQRVAVQDVPAHHGAISQRTHEPTSDRPPPVATTPCCQRLHDGIIDGVGGTGGKGGRIQTDEVLVLSPPPGRLHRRPECPGDGEQFQPARPTHAEQNAAVPEIVASSR